MTSGEKRFASRLEAKLEDDYLLWFDVSVGNTTYHPDFIIMHPLRGILILEVKDWKLETIQRIDKTSATIITSSGIKTQYNPFEQARIYAHAVVDLLKKDPALIEHEGSVHQGYLLFPWSYGVVLSNISRKQFDSSDLGKVLPPDRVICQDEMSATIDTEAFQQRLWHMFKFTFSNILTLPQIDRIRWHLFPEIRINTGEQQDMFGDSGSTGTMPDIIRIMDLQQEQLARSLGSGHRVIHGVAGSGKTMILAYRCQYLVKATKKPILVLCFNVPLATRLQALMAEKGLSHQVIVMNFHAWCHSQLKAYHVVVPVGLKGEAFYEQMVQQLIKAVDRGQVPSAQYGAVLIDEGHDFEPAWLKLVVQMISPETNTLLLLYDDAQSIYGKGIRRKFSFKSVGVQAVGRTTILKLNYRNTAEVLKTAYEFAKDVLKPEEADEDAIPLIKPESAERHGSKPELIKLPNFNKEVERIIEKFKSYREEGMNWSDMAVIYRAKFMGEVVSKQFKNAGIPVEWLQQNNRSRHYHPDDDSVKVATFHSSKGLEFPVVAIPGIGYLPIKNADINDEMRLMYVSMTRAMDKLLMTCHKESIFAERIDVSIEQLSS